MNIIGIDPSLSSTALVVNGKIYNYTTGALTKKNNLKKWYVYSEPYIKYRFIDLEYDKSTFTSLEVSKNLLYDEIVEMIIMDIKENIKVGEPIISGIEGYSYSSQSGPLIDLVTFGTKLRDSLIELSDEVLILPPTSLKKAACMLTYKDDNKGICRNKDGIAGGSFKKKEMYKVITENDNFFGGWINHLRSMEDDIMECKNVPKPYDDVNDGMCIFLYIKENYYCDKGKNYKS